MKEVDAEVKPYILCCWRAISNFALFTVQYSILNQQICISNDQWIYEGGVCYIKDLYSLLIWDTHIGNGLGRIILCDHGVGVIIQFFWKWWLNMNCIGDLVVQVLWYVWNQHFHWLLLPHNHCVRLPESVALGCHEMLW